MWQEGRPGNSPHGYCPPCCSLSFSSSSFCHLLQTQPSDCQSGWVDPYWWTLKEGFDGQWIWHSLTAIWLILSICIGGKESGFEGSVTFWYSLLVAISCWSLVLKASSSSTCRFNQAIAMKLCDFDCYELHRDMFLVVYRWWTERIDEDRCHLETETVRGGYCGI